MHVNTCAAYVDQLSVRVKRDIVDASKLYDIINRYYGAGVNTQPILKDARDKLQRWSVSGVCETSTYSPCNNDNSVCSSRSDGTKGQCQMELRARYPSYCTGARQAAERKPCKSKEDCSSCWENDGAQGCFFGFYVRSRNDCILPTQCEDLRQRQAALASIAQEGIPTLAQLPAMQQGMPNPTHLSQWTQDLQVIESAVADMLTDNNVMTASRAQTTEALLKRIFAVKHLSPQLAQKLVPENAVQFDAAVELVSSGPDNPTLQQVK